MNIGDKVVCVPVTAEDAAAEGCASCLEPQFKITGHGPVVGSVYVVRGFNFTGKGIKLVGSIIIHVPTNSETGWYYRAFRRLEEVQAENRLKLLKPEERPS